MQEVPAGESTLRYDRSADLEGDDALSEIARAIRAGSRVLDLGASTGKLGLYLRERKECVVDGVELDPDAVAAARPRYRTVLPLDLEKVDLRTHLPAASYDAIVCADVLEHLRDPGRVLDQLPALLAPDGRVLISIPNIGYAGVVAGLLTGEFRYRPIGLLDSTHLRFFTRSSLLELLAQHGFGATAIRPVLVHPHRSEFSETIFEKLSPAVLQVVLDAPDALVYQFVIEAMPGAHAPQIAELTRRPRLRSRVQVFWAGAGQSYSYSSAPREELWRPSRKH